jgi:hypothetical protein
MIQSAKLSAWNRHTDLYCDLFKQSCWKQLTFSSPIIVTPISLCFPGSGTPPLDLLTGVLISGRHSRAPSRYECPDLFLVRCKTSVSKQSLLLFCLSYPWRFIYSVLSHSLSFSSLICFYSSSICLISPFILLPLRVLIQLLLDFMCLVLLWKAHERIHPDNILRARQYFCALLLLWNYWVYF